MVHGMIGALWEATTMRQLYAASGATTAYLAWILSSYRGDMFSARAYNAESEDKTPKIMQRPSVNQFMMKEEMRIEAGQKTPVDGYGRP